MAWLEGSAPQSSSNSEQSKRAIDTVSYSFLGPFFTGDFCW